MEEKTLNEKESLELIARMIQTTRKNMEIGQGNLLLYFGYFAAVLGVVIYICIRLMGNGNFAMLWMLMFVCWLVVHRISKKPEVITYTDSAIASVWKVIGVMFCLTAVSLPIISMLDSGVLSVLMMPMSLFYMGIGTAITGVIIKDKVTTYLPLLGMLIPLYMLNSIMHHLFFYWWHLLFSLASVIIFVIPGHIINSKRGAA